MHLVVTVYILQKVQCSSRSRMSARILAATSFDLCFTGSIQSKMVGSLSSSNWKCPTESPSKNHPKCSDLPYKEISLHHTEISLLVSVNAPLKKFENWKNMVKSAKMKEAHPFTVSVEGNIGSGKSSLLSYFSSVPGVTTFQEPIDKWTNVRGYNLLQKLYENPKRWNFLFQSYVQLTRLHIHLQNSAPGIKLIERSFHNNRFCFVENDFHLGNLREEEFEVICKYFDFFEKHLNIGVNLIVYLRTTPEVAYERMRNRGRAEEAAIPLEYLQKVHGCYEKWLNEGNPRAPPAPVITINGDLELNSIVKEYEKKKNLILGIEVMR